MVQKIKILAIDETNETWIELKLYLERYGYEVLTVCDPEAALSLLDTSDIKLVILDENVPDTDFLELTKKINEIYLLPVIVISIQDNVIDAVIGLEIGAADFIIKPFNARELAARVKANIRLVQEIEKKVLDKNGRESKKDIIRFGRWFLDRNRMVVLDINKNPINLTTGEYRLLEALVLSSGKVLSREKLFELTHDEEFQAYDRAIDIQIARIRKKLEGNTNNHSLIKTIRGSGYMIDLEIKRVVG